ncbi:MAG: hypothetical protein Q7R34_16265 [Dehalococcoidia bacterium]|nr:hypothetical protein [Dehalococcoidia bacterium]
MPIFKNKWVIALVLLIVVLLRFQALTRPTPYDSTWNWIPGYAGWLVILALTIYLVYLFAKKR